MRITKLRIEAYRSLQAVEIDVERLTAVIGPNNAGKTNLVDALDFIGTAFSSHGLQAAVDQRGGMGRFSFRARQTSRLPTGFAATIRIKPDEIRTPRPAVQRWQRDLAERDRDRLTEIEIVYEVRLASRGAEDFTGFAVAGETIRVDIVDETTEPVLSIERDGNQIVFDTTASDQDWSRALAWPFSATGYDEFLREAVDSERMLAEVVPYSPVLTSVARLLGTLAVYHISPDNCRLPDTPSPFAQLDPTGAHLPSTLKILQSRFPSAWEAILDRMRELAPRLDDIEIVDAPDQSLVLQFREAGLQRPWSASEMSDGTVRLLGLLTALFDPRTPVVAIEEPENSLHPWLVRSFVGACRDAVDAFDKQVILTSHSPALINFLAPNEILVAWRDEDGQSRFQPLLALDPDVKTMWERGVAQLSDLLDIGLVREAVPGAWS